MKAKPSRGRRFAAIWRRKVRANVTGVLAVCFVFVTMIAAGVYYAREPAAVQGSAMISGSGHLAGAAEGKAASAAGSSSNLVGSPSETRIGQLMITKGGSDNCQVILFDNRTGGFRDAGEVFCGKSAIFTDSDSPDRLLALRKSFQR